MQDSDVTPSQCCSGSVITVSIERGKRKLDEEGVFHPKYFQPFPGKESGIISFEKNHESLFPLVGNDQAVK